MCVGMREPAIALAWALSGLRRVGQLAGRSAAARSCQRPNRAPGAVGALVGGRHLRCAAGLGTAAPVRAGRVGPRAGRRHRARLRHLARRRSRRGEIHPAAASRLRAGRAANTPRCTSAARNRCSKSACAANACAPCMRRCWRWRRPKWNRSSSTSTCINRRSWWSIRFRTTFDSRIESAPGSVSQVRNAALRLIRAAKETGTAVLLIGHVTKEGQIAGPRVLEHMVDVVLELEGERDFSFRILRAVKNRFGPTHELGVFTMGERGLEEVPNPSAAFLGERQARHPRLRGGRGDGRHALAAGRGAGAGDARLRRSARRAAIPPASTFAAWRISSPCWKNAAACRWASRMSSSTCRAG